MAQHPGFLRDIIERPGDDVPRLIYADWLEEQGESARAEFIRVQCGMARFIARESTSEVLPALDLLPEHQNVFLAPFDELGLRECGRKRPRTDVYPTDVYPPESGFQFGFRRGFVEHMQIFGGRALEDFVKQAEQIFALTPLLHVKVSCSLWIDPDNPDEWPGDYFDLYDEVTPQIVDRFLQCPQLVHLRLLDMGGCRLNDNHVPCFVNTRYLHPNLNLRLEQNQFSAEGTQRLLDRFGTAVRIEFYPGEDDFIPF